jgi:alpha-D-ribose 1-methylphosphonate 5-triphosphate synthase subunit PhnI
MLLLLRILLDPPRYTGGWGAFNAWEAEGRSRKRKKEEEEEADRLEALLIAEKVIEPETPPQKVVAFMVERPPAEVPEKVRAAIQRAVRSETDAAYDLALKRIRELEEEEDFTVLLTLALH